MNTNRQILNLSRLILLFIMSVMSVIHLSAETDSISNAFEDYEGLWLTEINDEAIYLLIKKNHTARYFYKDRIDNNVYKGTWKLDEENLLSISSLDFDSLSFQLEGDSTEAASSNAGANIPTLVKSIN